MSAKRKKRAAVDTEPEDVFAAILGDVDIRPVLQGGGGRENDDAPEKSAPRAKAGAPKKSAPPRGAVKKKAGAKAARQRDNGQWPAYLGLECGEEECVFRLKGEMAGERAPVLRKALLDCADKGAARFIIDMGAVSDMDAATMMVLLAFADQEASQRQGMAVVNAGPELRQLFNAARLRDQTALAVE